VIVRVLGSATVGGAAPRLERKAREVLTVLAVRAPAAVTLDELADLLWDDPPPSADKTIRAHLSRIRAAGAGVERVGRRGYRLTVPAEETDVGAVTAGRARARRLLADGRPDAAADLLAGARELWQGDPDLPDTTAAAALTQGWRRERRLLVQEHLGCLAAGDDPAQAIRELEHLTAADPLDEPLWVHYVRALHRAGRQTDALEAVAAARAALAEVGLSPGAALRDAQAGVLVGADPPRPAPPRQDPAAVRYANGEHGSTAYTCLGDRGEDLVVLSPAMLTIDGLLDEPRARAAFERLAGHARVICFDRHGIGLSDPLDPGRSPLEQWVDDLRQVLDTLGVHRADLFANFDTGLVALEFAARHPQRVRSLVLAQCYATYTRSPQYPFGLDRATTETLIRDSVTPAGPGLDTVAQAAPSVAGDDRFRDWWNRIGRRAASPATATAIRAAATGTDLRHRLPAVAAPTLVLHRRNCLNVDVGHARYLATHLPDARLQTVAGTDALWFTDTTDLLDAAVDFLTTRPPTR
jgi:pimeloyl-ACP methyl ester carboxylesterase/DNA-binding SARP family transcriptional activator